jgi:hypothetical protein
MKNIIATLFILFANAFFINNAQAQAPSLPNIVEIDPNVPVRIGWDFLLPDANVTGFKIFKKFPTEDGGEEWQQIGEFNIISSTTDLDLLFDLPAPYVGTYAVAAFNPEYDSDMSPAMTLVEAPVWTDIPAAPQNLRVIQLPEG